MDEQALIDDGYSQQSTIPRVVGMHPAVKLRFRPTLPEDRFQWLMDSQRAVDGKSQAKYAAALVGAHIESWDVKDRMKRDVSPKNDDLVRKLHPTLMSKVLDLILGYTPAQAEADAKNSGPASGSSS